VLEVLLVCTGNICRSPLALGILRERSRQLPEPLRVRSAGTAATVGQPATPEAIVAANELGADIRDHASTPLDPSGVEHADLVLAMASGHRAHVLERVPEAASRTFTLKELASLLAALPPAPSPPSRSRVLGRVAEADSLRSAGHTIDDEDVRDPLGLSLEAYRAVAWEIGQAVDRIVRGLFGAEARV
jgi:protein-tyrosine phosphatase